MRSATKCDACLDLLARALAPEPSGVPPEVKDALDNFAAVMQVAHPDVGERQRRQRAARDAVLSAIRATTEVERVAEAARSVALDMLAEWGEHQALRVFADASRDGFGARVVARLSGATHE